MSAFGRSSYYKGKVLLRNSSALGIVKVTEEEHEALHMRKAA